MSERATWYETWGRVAQDVAQRSRCSRNKIGAVIVSPRERVVATGYNGPPANWRPHRLGMVDLAEPGQLGITDNCRDWCPRGRGTLGPGSGYDNCPSNHAEINALMHSSRTEREGGMIYVTGWPCMTCAKAIANSGITRVALVNVDDETESYRNPVAVEEFLANSHVDVFRVDL